MFGADALNPSPVDTVAHIIQVALTPVFLLSGIAALLNVFSTRLARVADRFDQLQVQLEQAAPDAADWLAAQLSYLRRRSLALDAAVILGTFGGGATCAAALALFVGALRNSTVAGLLFVSFGLALICTTGALAAFLAEMLMASRGLRRNVEASRSEMRDEAETGSKAENPSADRHAERDGAAAGRADASSSTGFAGRKVKDRSRPVSPKGAPDRS